MSYNTLPGAPPDVAKTKAGFPLRLGKLRRNDFIGVGAWAAKHGAPIAMRSALVVSAGVAFLRGITCVVCMSSNGFGQIGSKTKRGFQDSYKPFLPFQQVSKCGSASGVKASFFV